jgi:hypothetical protein
MGIFARRLEEHPRPAAARREPSLQLSGHPGGREVDLPAPQAGARAVFGFPLRVGTVRLGALNLHRDRPGPLSGDQHADALVVASVAARWVLETQAGAPPDTVAEELERGADFHFVVHNAAGMVSVQEQVSVTEALIRMRAFAFSHDRLLAEVARDIVARRLRLG